MSKYGHYIQEYKNLRDREFQEFEERELKELPKDQWEGFLRYLDMKSQETLYRRTWVLSIISITIALLATIISIYLCIEDTRNPIPAIVLVGIICITLIGLVKIPEKDKTISLRKNIWEEIHKGKLLILFATTALTVISINQNAIAAPNKDESDIVDEFQIHTPIMAPGTIQDGNLNPVNAEERHSSVPTSLVKDDSDPDTSNLRLDQYYFIKWIDLKSLTNARYKDRDKEHRDGQDYGENTAGTPTWGGYAEQTDNPSTKYLEEDQFTTAKYMKFPFEVFYDGYFYKANQWIKIHKPDNTKPEDSEDGKTTYEGWSKDPNPRIKANGELVSDNHWVYTPIYIPTWAKEGLYEDIEMPSDDRYHPDDMLENCVQLRVEAVNVEGDRSSRADDLQKIANTAYNVRVRKYDDNAAYAAIFNLPAQLSGWIYDFTITGISDRDTFESKALNDLASHIVEAENGYSFTAHKQDKRSGLKNRLGWPAVRYHKDGLIAKEGPGGTVSWNAVNTVALDGAWKDNTGTLHYGKSNAWKLMGTVPKGTTFSFTLKTISNMWNFNGRDKITITPTFAYEKFDKAAGSWIKRANNDLKVYYSWDDKHFMPYGSQKDKETVQEAWLGNIQFDESYYTAEDSSGYKRYGDWVTYAAYQHNINYGLINPLTMTFAQFKTAVENGSASIRANALTPNMWLNTKHAIYCLSNITIPERLRLLSGEPDQLKMNNYKNGYDINDKDGGADLFLTYENIGDFLHEYTARFSGGEYTDPSQEQPTIIINGTTKNISLTDKFRYSIQSWYGKYYVPQDLYVVDLTEHPEFRDFSDPLSPYHTRRAADGSVTMPDGRKYWDYIDYYATEDYKNHDGLTDDEDIFLPDGFLTVNFDIIAVKNGTKHLRYNGPYGGEWGAEGYIEVPDSPKIAPPEPGKTEDGVPTDIGDTIVVDLSKKFTDRYRAGLFNIN